MQYELYIDVFFLVNFMMDYMLLMLLRRILLNCAGHGRIVLGAFAGAAMTCIVIILPIPYVPVKLILFHGVVNIVMLKTGLKLKGGREFVKAVLFLYAGSFLVGGVMGWLRQYMRTGSLFFALALLGYWTAYGIWSLLEALARHKQTHCTVILYRGEMSCQINALLDTGNRLSDTLTGKPVSIITPDTAEHLGLSKLPEVTEAVRYISYQSIGNKNGVLPVFCIDKMCLRKKGKKTEVDFPMIAVCKDELDSDEYQMILNPDIYNF